MDPLTGPLLKLEKTQSKIEGLRSALTAYGNDLKSDGITVKKDPDTGEMVFRLRVTKSTTADPNWSIEISEIAHLLRSCLDNLAWQVALLNTHNPFLRTEYPIYLSRRTTTGSSYIPDAISKTKGRTKGKSQSIHSKHRAMMEKTQPYHRRKCRQRDPLWMLHTMNNADKHRDIHFTTVANLGNVLQIFGGAPSMIARGLTLRAGIPFEDGEELMRIKSLIAASPVKMNPKYSVDVCFDGRCPSSFAKLPVIKTLNGIKSRVEEIVEMFTPEFT